MHCWSTITSSARQLTRLIVTWRENKVGMRCKTYRFSATCHVFLALGRGVVNGGTTPLLLLRTIVVNYMICEKKKVFERTRTILFKMLREVWKNKWNYFNLEEYKCQKLA